MVENERRKQNVIFKSLFGCDENVAEMRERSESQSQRIPIKLKFVLKYQIEAPLNHHFQGRTRTTLD
jgi:hypothetical protein